MRQVIQDRLELDNLIMTENKRGYLARSAHQLKDQIARIANYNPGGNGVATAAPTTTDDDTGIVNRSPRISKSVTNAAARSDGPWVALIVILMLLLVAGGLVWWTSFGPRPEKPPIPPAPVPVPVVQPPANQPGQKQDYLEFFKF